MPYCAAVDSPPLTRRLFRHSPISFVTHPSFPLAHQQAGPLAGMLVLRCCAVNAGNHLESCGVQGCGLCDRSRNRNRWCGMRSTTGRRSQDKAELGVRGGPLTGVEMDNGIHADDPGLPNQPRMAVSSYLTRPSRFPNLRRVGTFGVKGPCSQRWHLAARGRPRHGPDRPRRPAPDRSLSQRMRSTPPSPTV